MLVRLNAGVLLSVRVRICDSVLRCPVAAVAASSAAASQPLWAKPLRITFIAATVAAAAAPSAGYVRISRVDGDFYGWRQSAYR